jgi:tetratricopeptide (TPR) repeat protein
VKRGLALVVAVVLVYAVALHAPFTYDDRIEVVGNRTIRALGEWSAIAGYHPNRPLLILSYALDWAWSGLDPFGYHVVSVAIHALNAALAWRLATRLVDPERALLAAATWALHPLCTEAVTYVTGRSDALSGTFWLLALLGWVDHRRGLRGPGLAWGAMVAALLTKELAVFLPLAFWGLSRFALGERPRLRTFWPAAVAVGAAVGVRVLVWGLPAAEVPRGALAQLGAQAEAWTVYLRLWVLPWGQSILHDHPGELRPAGIVAVVAWLLAGAWVLRRGGLPAACFLLGAAWLLPGSLVPLREVLAEHRSYLAGFALILGLVAAVPLRRAAWVLPLVLAALTVRRNLVWRDEVTLWHDAVDGNPASADAWYGYADALRFAQRPAEAEAAFREVLTRRPGDDNAEVNLGIAIVLQGRSEEARATWEGVLRRNPRSCAAHNDLAALDLRAGRVPAAAAGYASTLYWCPDDLLALRALGGIYAQMGDYRRATDTLRRYLEQAPPGPERDDASDALRRLSP